MRVLFIILLGIACGTGLGVTISWARYGRAPLDQFTVSAADSSLKPPTNDEPQPRIAVAEDAFDFGDLQIGSEVHHEFPVSNTGDGNLHLVSGGTTCAKCTIDRLPQSDLAPGESEEITITYRAGALGPFRQTATILTNDPLHPRIALVVSGKVVSMLKLVPSDVVFSRLVSNEPATADVRVLCYTDKPLEITGHQFLDSETARLFEVQLDPLPQEDLDKEEAHSGVLLHIKALAGLPSGTLRQTLLLNTNQSISPNLEVPIQGRVEGAISLAGAGWDADSGTLSLGDVKSAAGARRQVFLLVRGPGRREVQVHVGKSDPSWLKLEVGQPQEVNDGAVVKIPLVVVIPPGSPAANHMGTAQGKLAHVVLETTLPTARQVNIYLQFLVEN